MKHVDRLYSVLRSARVGAHSAVLGRRRLLIPCARIAALICRLSARRVVRRTEVDDEGIVVDDGAPREPRLWGAAKPGGFRRTERARNCGSGLAHGIQSGAGNACSPGRSGCQGRAPRGRDSIRPELRLVPTHARDISTILVSRTAQREPRTLRKFRRRSLQKEWRNDQLLFAVVALGLLVLPSRDANAWFKVCNRSEDMWVAYSHTNKHERADQAMQHVVWRRCPYSAWLTQGWWRVSPNQCATTLGGDIKNRYNYVRIETQSGSTIGGTVWFPVSDYAFRWHDREIALPENPSYQCLGSVTHDCGVTSRNALFRDSTLEPTRTTR